MIGFDTKAITYLGHSRGVLQDWKREGRKYREELEKTGAEPDVKDPRYKFLYVVLRLEREQYEFKARHVQSIQQAGLGRDAEYLTDENGKLVLDKEGHPIKIRDSMRPNYRASKYILGVVDRDFAPRTRHDFQQEDEDGKPTDFVITVKESRPAPINQALHELQQ